MPDEHCESVSQRVTVFTGRALCNFIALFTTSWEAGTGDHLGQGFHTDDDILHEYLGDDRDGHLAGTDNNI